VSAWSRRSDLVALSFRRLRDAGAEENIVHITCMQYITWNHTAGGQGRGNPSSRKGGGIVQAGNAFYQQGSTLRTGGGTG